MIAAPRGFTVRSEAALTDDRHDPLRRWGRIRVSPIERSSPRCAMPDLLVGLFLVPLVWAMEILPDESTDGVVLVDGAAAPESSSVRPGSVSCISDRRTRRSMGKRSWRSSFSDDCSSNGCSSASASRSANRFREPTRVVGRDSSVHWGRRRDRDQAPNAIEPFTPASRRSWVSAAGFVPGMLTRQ